MSKYAVASSHPLSTLAGEEALAKGGNAYDAMLATSAALTVVQPHLNGLGGDMFATIRDKNIYCINASGFAAEMATPDFFKSKKLDKIPKSGHLSSFSLPGMVSAWKIIMGKINLTPEEDFKRAIKYARNGFRKSLKLDNAIKNFDGDEDFNKIYKNDSSILYQKDLGDTLENLSKNPDDFYNGKIARMIEGDMKNKGGLVRLSDLEKYNAEIREPMHVNYHGYNISTNPPVSQGVTELIWLKLMDKYDLSSMNDDDYYDILIKNMKESYKYRKYIYDGSSLNVDNFKSFKIDELHGKNSENSDTTAFSIFDGEIEISAIQSNYMGFGSGHNVKGTGININNRGSYFSLDEGNNNTLKPFKKTFHTLMSTIASGKNEIMLGSMGGDIQPEVNVQILSKIIDRNMKIQDAINYPRFAYLASIYSDSDIYYERPLNLKNYIKVESNNSMMGHAQGIIFGENVEAGFDPRGDAFEKY